jgi:hypothetical protein
MIWVVDNIPVVREPLDIKIHIKEVDGDRRVEEYQSERHEE